MRGVRSFLQAFSARIAAALGRFPSALAPSAQCPASEGPDGSAPLSLEWRGPGVGSAIDWLPGADWVLDRRLRKWQQGEPAVFPAADAEPPRGLLETDGGADNDDDNPSSGGLCPENGTLTLDGYNDALRNPVEPQGCETTIIDSREQDNDCAREVPARTMGKPETDSNSTTEAP